MPLPAAPIEDTTLYTDTHLYDTMTWGGCEPIYLDAALRSGGPVLELGCGTGRMLVPMAQRGLSVTGIDQSVEMLATARQRLTSVAASATVVEGDMSRFTFPESFAFIFCAINSLLHLLETDDLRSCFASVRRALRPDGQFMFDIVNFQPAYLAIGPGERHTVGEYESDLHGRYRIEETLRYDATTQIAHKTFFYSAAGAPDFRLVHFPLRVIFPQELEALLALEGLRLETRLGDRSGEPFHSGSPSQLCIVRHA